MKTIKKNVYYCEYCNKHGLSASHISQHEKHCTRNLNRECRLCGNITGYKEEIESLKKRFKVITEKIEEGFTSIRVEWIGKEITLDEIRDLVHDCPVCILSVMRLTGLTSGWHNFDFNYKQELKDHWKEQNERQEINGIDY